VKYFYSIVLKKCCCFWRLNLLFSAVFLSLIYTTQATAQQVPEVLLAQVYKGGIAIPQYLVSEKLDGVRAVWDGQVLKTRAGNVIAAPDWFTSTLPTTPLDGELWMAHGQFDALSGAVRKVEPIEAEWRKIQYRVFELPNASGTFAERAKRIEQIVQQAHLPHLQAVPQFYVKDEAELKRKLAQVVAAGGEGLMLHRADALYVTGRTSVLLKLKPMLDAEATVIAHTAGHGRYQGKLGALVVQTPEGLQFKLGTGFTDAQRENPPKIGSVVTYTYRDVTKNGKPKFASFLRVRNE
jgi:DNA ligase-1